jgi:hypothetical protein
MRLTQALRRPIRSFSWALLVVLAFALGSPANGQQNRIDVKDCFSPILKDKVSDSDIRHDKYLFLTLINKDNYEAIKANTSASAIYGGAIFSGDFNYFREQRERYFEFESKNIEQYEAKQYSREYLPLGWRPTIETCINNAFQSASMGLTYYTALVDEKTATLRLKYRTMDKAPNFKVLSSHIDNGIMVDSYGEHRDLYKPCSFKCPPLEGKTVFTLKRIDLNKPIVIELNIKPSRNEESITISPMPPNVECNKGYDEDHKIKSTLTYDKKTSLLPGTSYKYQTLWKVQDDVSGRVVAVKCYPTDSYMNVLNDKDPDDLNLLKTYGVTTNPSWTGSTFRCFGMTNTGDPRTITIEVTYEPPKTKCEDKPWGTPSSLPAFVENLAPYPSEGSETTLNLDPVHPDSRSYDQSLLRQSNPSIQIRWQE